MKYLYHDKIRHVLIRSSNWVGDAILTTPAVRAIRKNFPNAEISILAKPWVSPVFYNNPDIDHIIDFDAAGRHRGWMGKVRLSRELRKKKFDLAILLQNAFEAAVIACLAGIPNRLGFNTDGRGFLLTHGVHLKPFHQGGHHIDYYLGMLEGADLKLNGRKLSLRVTDRERDHAEDILKRHRIAETDRLVGINPGAAYGSAKRWFPGRYAAVGSQLHKSHGVRIVIFGGPGEEALGQKISEQIGGASVSLSGKTSLREAIALIERCCLFITNDSGLMHVAAALDVPQIAIFGSTDHLATGPSNPRSRIVRVPFPCSPCLKQECATGHHCMKAITVDMVYAVAEKILQRDGTHWNPEWGEHGHQEKKNRNGPEVET
jgi:heptosyltransferase-2